MEIQSPNLQTKIYMPDNNTPSPIGTAALGIGTSVATGAIGSLLGLALEHHNDKRQLAQQTKLQNLQIQGQQQMADYNYNKQLEMWKATNYPAQMEQLKEAGLNPALIYGQSGGGGTTIGSGYSEGVIGAQAPSGGGERIAAMGMGIQMQQQAMQLQLLKAQKDNIEADTAAKQASANYTSGAQTAATTAQTENLLQDVENKKAQEQLTKVQTAIQQVDLGFDKASYNDRLDYITQQARQMTGLASQALIEANVGTMTEQTRINIVKASYIGQLLQNTKTSVETNSLNQSIVQSKSEVMLNSQRYRTMAQDMMNKWDSLSNDDQKINMLRTQLQLQDAPESVLKDLMQHIDLLIKTQK